MGPGMEFATVPKAEAEAHTGLSPFVLLVLPLLPYYRAAVQYLPRLPGKEGTMPMYRGCQRYPEQLLSSKAARVTPSRSEMALGANVPSWQG